MSAVDAILKAARNQIPVQTRVAKVTSVNEQEMSCDVDVEGLAPRKRVRLRAVISGSGGFVVIPQVNSYVLIALIDNKPESCVVIQTSEIDKVLIDIQGATLEMTDKKLNADILGTKMELSAQGVKLSKGAISLKSVLNKVMASIIANDVAANDGAAANSPNNTMITNEINQLFS